ncbi:hypothetical protein [Leptotrichia wadei]|nr:hypothetical protein [Leptotrichia wadei]
MKFGALKIVNENSQKQEKKLKQRNLKQNQKLFNKKTAKATNFKSRLEIN